MRFVYLFILLAITAPAFGQIDASGSKMVVVGNASKTISLDLLRIRFNFDAKDKTQKAVSQKVNDQTEKLLGQLTNFGINESDMKVTSVGYGEDYDYTSEKPKRTGYTASKSYELQVKYNARDFSELMDSIYALNLRDLRMNIELQMSASQKETVDKELIKLAIADAQRSARSIADALGLSIESIYSITYADDSNGKGVAVQPIQKRIDVTKEGGAISIPNDQSMATRSISITWNIRRR